MYHSYQCFPLLITKRLLNGKRANTKKNRKFALKEAEQYVQYIIPTHGGSSYIGGTEKPNTTQDWLAWQDNTRS